MATLEDAAAQLVVKLKGLDSEIEESQHALDEGRQRVEEAAGTVEEEWSALGEAVTSFLQTLREEQDELAGAAEEALRALAEARRIIQESGSEARSDASGGAGNLRALSQHATALGPGLESLVAEAGEAPALGLARRAQEVEQELARVLGEARDFLQEEVVAAVERVVEGVRERCQGLRARLAEESVDALQTSFEDWEGKVGELERFVSSQGFLASHSHARAVVSWSLEQCRNAADESLDAVKAVVDEAARPLESLSNAIAALGGRLAEGVGALAAELDGTRASAGQATSALEAVRGLLASYSFVEA